MNYAEYSKRNEKLINSKEFFKKDQLGEFTWDAIVAVYEIQFAE